MRKDIVALCCLTLIGTLGSAFCFNALMPEIGEGRTHDMWFDADPSFVLIQMTDPWTSHHWRVEHHPVFSLLTTPIGHVLLQYVGIPRQLTLQIFLMMAGGACTALFYGIVRKITASLWAGTLFTGLFLANGSFLYWCGIADTFIFGMLSVLLAVFIITHLRGPKYSELFMTLAGVSSLAVTVTNWMVGIAGAVACHRPTRAVQICVNAFFIVVVGVAIQSVLIPKTAKHVFFSRDFGSESRWVAGALDTSVSSKTRVFFLGNILVPPSVPIDRVGTDRNWTVLSVQHSLGGPLWFIGGGLWMVLFGLGVYGLTCERKISEDSLAFVLLSTIAGQLLLHLIYGLETFLYSPHYGPLLILISAFAYRGGRNKKVAISLLACVFFAIMIINNGGEFMESARFVQEV